MFHLFNLLQGCSMTLDCNRTTLRVVKFQEAIKKKFSIALHSQILISNDGQIIENNNNLISSKDFTDPIYLYSKEDVLSCLCSQLSTAEIDEFIAVNFHHNFDAILKVDKRNQQHKLIDYVQLVEKYCKLARYYMNLSSRIANEYYTHYKGWLAVLKNFDNATKSFQMKYENFILDYILYLNEKQYCLNALYDMRKNLNSLKIVPHFNRQEYEAEVLEEDPEQERRTRIKRGRLRKMSYLKFLSMNKNFEILNRYVEFCIQFQNVLNIDFVKVLDNLLKRTIAMCDQPNMKDLKGLAIQLMNLEQLEVEVRLLAKRQFELAEAIFQLKNGGETEVDMVGISEKLMLMMKNHSKLRSTLRSCLVIKEELRLKVHSRLKWILALIDYRNTIENKLYMLYLLLTTYSRTLKMMYKSENRIKKIADKSKFFQL